MRLEFVLEELKIMLKPMPGIIFTRATSTAVSGRRLQKRYSVSWRGFEVEQGGDDVQGLALSI